MTSAIDHIGTVNPFTMADLNLRQHLEEVCAKAIQLSGKIGEIRATIKSIRLRDQNHRTEETIQTLLQELGQCMTASDALICQIKEAERLWIDSL